MSSSSSPATRIGRAFLGQSPPASPAADALPESDVITFLTALSAPTHDPAASLSIATTGDDRVMRHPSSHRIESRKATQGLDGGDEWTDHYVRAVLAFEKLQGELPYFLKVTRQ